MNAIYRDFQELLSNQTIIIQNKNLNELLKKFSFHFITSNQSDDSIISYMNGQSSIVVDEYVEFESNKKINSDYYIICDNKMLIIYEKTQFSKYFQFFCQNKQSTFYFTSEKLREELKSLSQFNFNLINECSNIVKRSSEKLSKELNLRMKRNYYKIEEINAFWSIIKRSISYHLILNGLKKSRIDRFLYFDDFFNEESNKKEIKFDESEFIDLETMENGSSASVNLFYHVKSEKIYICKIFYKNELTEHSFEVEKTNYSNIHHPLFPRFYSTMINSNDYSCLLLEYIDGVTLTDIKSLKYINKNDKIKIVFQLMTIIEYLHLNGFIYRDLKPDNIIIDRNKTIFLLDFNKMIKQPKMKEEMTFSVASNFVAPEILNGAFYTSKVDIFSLGFIIKYMFSNDEINESNLNILINECINEDPDRRPTISELIDVFYSDYFSKITPVFIESIKSFHEKQYFRHLFLITEYSNPEAQYQLGLIYKKGIHVPKNIEKAIQFFDQSAKSNHLKSLVKLGKIFNNGKYVQCDNKKALKYFQIAADQDDSEAQYYMGFFYTTGIVVPIDNKKGLEYLKLSAQKNNKHAYHQLGILLFSTQHLDEAIHYFKIAADLNCSASQHCLGTIYSNEKFNKIDIQKALYYFTLAANQNYSYSQLDLAKIYFYGKYIEKDIEKVIHFCKLASDNGLSEAQWILFQIYYDAKYARKDNFLSIHYLQLAANNNHTNSQYVLGFFLLEGINVDININKGIYYLTQAANKNNSNAQRKLGIAYYYGHYVKQDIPTALYYLTHSSDQNNSEAQFDLGRIYYEGMYIKQDINKAIQLLTLSANQNDSNAQYYLGDIYIKGTYIKRDINKGIYYLNLSANQNNYNALAKLGSIYYEGQFVNRDVNKGIYYLTLATESGNPNSLFNLGHIYLEGIHIPKDINKAIHYLELSAAQNHAISQRTLGLVYSEGIYIKPDVKKAFYYLSLSANQNDHVANSQLGYIYYMGILVPQDMEKAIHYFTLAANHSVSFAQFYLGIIYSQMKNNSKAIYYLTLAANQSHREAEKYLGLRYLLGKKKDINKAIYYLTRAAEKDCVDSNHILGTIYCEGKLVPRSYEKSIHFFKNASSFNYVYSKNSLGVIYKIVMHNIGYAMELFTEAIRKQHNELSIYNLAHIYFYDQKSIDKTIELLLKSLKDLFDPSLILLSLALIKKAESFDIEKIQLELNKLENINSFYIRKILNIIHEYKLNDENNYKNVYLTYRNENFVYDTHCNIVSFSDLISFNYEDSNKKNNFKKDIDENFYKGFNDD